VEQPHNLERLEEVTARPYVLNNKIYPGTPACDKAEDLQKRQVHLQKIICILLCTVFPFLTTVATLLRLWQVGVFTFTVQPVCPKGWHSFSSSCLSPLPIPSNWSSAVSDCQELGAQLPAIHSEKLNSFLVTKFQPPLWLSAQTGNTSWADGTAFNFSKLNSSQPSVVPGSCLVLTPGGGWEARGCQLQYLTVCNKTTNLEQKTTTGWQAVPDSSCGNRKYVKMVNRSLYYVCLDWQGKVQEERLCSDAVGKVSNRQEE